MPEYLMPDRPLRTRRRLPELLNLKEDFQQVTLTEDRRREWRNLLIAAVLCVGLGGVVILSVINDPDLLTVVSLIVGLLLGIPLLIAVFLVYPWNRQVLVDSRDGLCSLRMRFYTIPYRTIPLSLTHGKLGVEKVLRPRITRESPQDENGGLAVLSLLLGPFGLLITGIGLVSSIKKTEIPAWALVYRDCRSLDIKPRVLLTCRSNLTLLKAERIYSGWIY
jgi:hypothetical protein